METGLGSPRCVQVSDEDVAFGRQAKAPQLETKTGDNETNCFGVSVLAVITLGFNVLSSLVLGFINLGKLGGERHTKTPRHQDFEHDRTSTKSLRETAVKSLGSLDDSTGTTHLQTGSWQGGYNVFGWPAAIVMRHGRHGGLQTTLILTVSHVSSIPPQPR